MEHRHHPRERVDMPVELISGEGKTYLARILELSAIGMRVVLNEGLPGHIKSIGVRLPNRRMPTEMRSLLRMFVVHKDGLELGLCLVNEEMRSALEKFYADYTLPDSHRDYAASR